MSIECECDSIHSTSFHSTFTMLSHLSRCFNLLRVFYVARLCTICNAHGATRRSRMPKYLKWIHTYTRKYLHAQFFTFTPRFPSYSSYVFALLLLTSVNLFASNYLLILFYTVASSFIATQVADTAILWQLFRCVNSFRSRVF